MAESGIKKRNRKKGPPTPQSHSLNQTITSRAAKSRGVLQGARSVGREANERQRMKEKVCLLKSMNKHCQLHIRVDTRTMDLNNGLFRPPNSDCL